MGSGIDSCTNASQRFSLSECSRFQIRPPVILVRSAERMMLLAVISFMFFPLPHVGSCNGYSAKKLRKYGNVSSEYEESLRRFTQIQRKFPLFSGAADVSV